MEDSSIFEMGGKVFLPDHNRRGRGTETASQQALMGGECGAEFISVDWREPLRITILSRFD
jgi:hypothetical protein